MEKNSNDDFGIVTRLVPLPLLVESPTVPSLLDTALLESLLLLLLLALEGAAAALAEGEEEAGGWLADESLMFGVKWRRACDARRFVDAV